LKEAERIGYILENPAKRMIKICRTEKIRGCLTSEEVSSLCALLNKKKSEMHSSYYLAIVLALCTGMRSGEVRALNISDLVPSNYKGWTRVNIVHSIATYTGLKGTKGNYERAVLIPDCLAEELRLNADKRGVCMPSKQKVGYISAPTLRNTFYELLTEIGISENEREKRNITFHSLRHTFSTLGRDSLISQEDRMVVLGHKSTDVNNRYTHISEEALYRVSALTGGLFAIVDGVGKSESAVS
jgi:integrase